MKKTIRTTRRFTLVTLFLAINSMAFSQLTIDNTTMTATQLVQNVLVGSGVTVSNVTYNGLPGNTVYPALGSFTATATNLGLASGVIMGTGDCQVAVGPNTIGSSSLGGGGFVQTPDADLQSIAGANIFDKTILEFDFIPQGDTIRFNYVFGSEEYPEFVNGGFNDAFGFFLSGPGITGPYTNSAINIALVPGTSTPVTIDNVNNGTANTGPCTNCAYYVNNVGGATIQYDGMTVVMEAVAAVQCGQTYHIKLAIGDAGDNNWDSGVFLEEGSFNSSGINVSLATVTGGNTITEGCPNSATFIFFRPDTTGNFYINYDIDGNAINGVDYNQIPDSILIAAGSNIAFLTLTAIPDGVTEGVDTLIITVYSINSCGDTIPQTATLYIYDPIPIVANAGPDQIGCPGQYSVFSASQTGGTAPFTYNWSFGSTNQIDSIQPVNTQQYVVTVSDWCGQSDSDTMLLTIPPNDAVFVTLASDTITELCTGVANFIFTHPDSTNGYTVHFVISGTATSGSDYVPMTDSVVFPAGVGTIVVPFTPIADGVSDNNETFIITITNILPCGNVVSTATLTIVDPVPLNVNVGPDLNVTCPGQTLNIVANVTGGLNPYGYTWSNGPTTSSISVQPLANAQYIVTVTDACGFTADDTISVTVAPYMNYAVTLNNVNVLCAGDQATLNAVVTAGGTQPYTYLWNTGGTTSSITVTPAATTTYNVTITDACGMDTTLSVTANVPVYGPFDASTNDGETCMTVDGIVELPVSATGGAGGYTYSWTTPLTGPVITVDAINGTGTVYNPVTGIYIVVVMDQCDQMAIDTADVTVIPCALTIPNVFSPNGDGSNDAFVITNLEFHPNSALKVFNRWGQELYSSSDYKNDWTAPGVPDGVYYYILKLTDGYEPGEYSGFVHLLRTK